MPKRTHHPPVVEIIDDSDRALGREVEAYEYLKATTPRWTDAELIELANRGHVEAGRQLVGRALRKLAREARGRGLEKADDLDPLTRWLIELLFRVAGDPELRRVVAPRERRGRRPAARDLWTAGQRRAWMADVVAEVERRRSDPHYDRNTKALYHDVAVAQNKYRPQGFRPITGATVKKWYYQARRG